jgi:hypothetical protein
MGGMVGMSGKVGMSWGGWIALPWAVCPTMVGMSGLSADALIASFVTYHTVCICMYMYVYV